MALSVGYATGKLYSDGFDADAKLDNAMTRSGSNWPCNEKAYLSALRPALISCRSSFRFEVRFFDVLDRVSGVLNRNCRS